ncbi:MAG: CorA family divalent cation transporter [Defluviicoccus sp.]|nr:CorA family divalent cation transporter [Defluviicoccus sp.]MDG4607858.1 CorA family divalent cation transporter [Defluviicoccus sp.]
MMAEEAARAGRPTLDLPAGVEPGLRFAVVLDGKGGCAELDWQGVAAWKPEQGFLWVHLERDAPEAQAWVMGPSGIDPLIAEALIAEDSRPRVEHIDDALLLILRGINLAPGSSLQLVPLHVWIMPSRALTLRDKTHALSALRDIRIALKNGRGPRGPGGLLGQIADKMVRDLDPVLEEMEDEVEGLEEEIIGTAMGELRREIADIRRRAIHLRRYLGPQRDALYQLRNEDTAMLDKRDRMRLRGVIDSLVRHIEDLDAIRDRTSLLHDDLAAMISEKIARTTYRFTAIAGLLLPPSLVAGLLGANIGGIPGQENPDAFFELAGLIVFLLGVQAFILRRMGWI